MQKQLPFKIIHEDKDIIAVYKKPGLLCIATDKDETHNLYHYVREYANLHRQKIFIVHRLDKETSGVVIFAKSIVMKEKLQKAFEDRTVQRYYEAVIKEDIPLGTDRKVVQYLYRDKTSGRVFVTDDRKKGLEAITFLKANNKTDFGTVLDVRIQTGRQNQIRLAIHSQKWTLIGDEKYSHDDSKRMYLNEYKLIFPKTIRLSRYEFSVEPSWLRIRNEENQE